MTAQHDGAPESGEAPAFRPPEAEAGMPERPGAQGDEDIDEVARVLQQLKDEVRRQHARLRPDEPHGAGAPVWPAALEQVRATARVNPHLPIAWPEWPPGVWAKVEALAQKVVRRLLRWYINPIVEQQNRFNAATAQSLEATWRQIVRLEEALARRAEEDTEGDQ